MANKQTPQRDVDDETANNLATCFSRIQEAVLLWDSTATTKQVTAATVELLDEEIAKIKELLAN